MFPPPSLYSRDSENDDLVPKKSKKKIKAHHGSKSVKTDPKDDDDYHPFVDEDLVPVPIPDTYKHHKTRTQSATKLASKSASQANAATIRNVHPSHTSDPVPTHNLAATVPSETLSVALPHPSSISSTPKTGSASPFQMSTLAIVLLAAGSAVLIVGLAILIKACSKPKKRWYPTPSLPILQDDPFESEGSPLFGGKERLSRPETIQWTQYTQPSYSSEKTMFSTSPDAKTLDYTNFYPAVHPVSLVKFDPAFPTPTVPLLPHLPPTRIPVRSSTISASIYPASPSSRRSLDIGIAVTTPAPALTADGHPIMTRARTKSITRRSRSQSMYSPSNLAYDGFDVASPALQTAQSQPLHPLPAPTMPSQAGRTPTRSSYIQRSVYGRWPENKSSDHAADPCYQASKPVGEYQDRDTRALTTALGLQTPVLGIETPATIYPEDSLSVKSPALPKKGVHKEGPTSRFSMSLGGGADTSLALGSLMMMDYGTNDKSSTDLLSKLTSEERNAGKKKQPIDLHQRNFQMRDDDRPPRVPSPPQFPSLAQMAMEHENPEGYANYHSPTYSIFGMYDPNRRSRA